MNSSYALNNYKDVFDAIVLGFRPVACVELGVLHGYSTFAIAAGLKKNNLGHLNAYDLFEDYPYNHGSIREVRHERNERQLGDWVTIHKENIIHVHDYYDPLSVSLLHVDLSNDGSILRDIIARWHEKIKIGGVILFEGGTEERDNVEWMIKYKREPIRREMETNRIINTCYVSETYLKFPGLTMFIKRKDSEDD